VVKNTAIVLGRVHKNFLICSRPAMYVVAIFYTYGRPCAQHQSKLIHITAHLSLGVRLRGDGKMRGARREVGIV